MIAATLPRVHPVSQFNDPTTTADGQNCTSASFAMLGELATGKRLHPGEFRKLQSDQEGGISIPDGARAWQKAYPDAELLWAAANDGTPVPPGKQGSTITAQGAWELLSAGYGLVLQGVYAVFEKRGYSLQPGFREGHAIYLDGNRETFGRQAYVIDPLGRPPYNGQWIPWVVISEYALALGRGGFYAAWASPKLPDTSTGDPVIVPGDDFNFGWESYTLDMDHTVYCIGGVRNDDGSTDSDSRLCAAGPNSQVLTVVARDRLTNGKKLPGSDALFAVLTSGTVVDNFNQGVEAAAQKALTAKR